MAQQTRTLTSVAQRDAVSRRNSGAQAMRSSAPVVRPFAHSPIVRGRDAVIALRPLLAEMGRRTGQPGVFDQIHILVKAPTALRKIPNLVLVGLPAGLSPHQATADDLQGIVLLYEYTVGGIGTGVFATDDSNGERTVLAPRERRAAVAEQACRILIAWGAAVALVSVESAAPGPRLTRPELEAPGNVRIGMRVRTQGRDLYLQPTLDSTMAAFGRNTRRNFRRYRLRAETQLGATFVPWVRMPPEEFLELNRASTNPVSEGEAAWRYHFITASHKPLFSGLCTAEGRWLSLIGGTRRKDQVTIEWQVNRAGLPCYSISTVMRAYLLEHEISLGTSKLIFQGGTPHSMGLSLAPAQTLDIIAVKRGLRGWLLRRLSHWGLPRPNFLGRALEDVALSWVA